MAKKVIEQCDTPGCDDDAESCGLCSACYSWAWYHKQQGVAANQEYKKRQRRTAARIEQHMPDKRPTKSAGSRTRQGESRAYLN